MKRIIACILALLLLLNIPLALAEYAAVKNPDPAERLNLRERATTASASLGQYWSGTVVRVLSREGEWAKVEVGSGDGSLTGYMKDEFLYFPDEGGHPPVMATPLIDLTVIGQMEQQSMHGNTDSGSPLIAWLRGGSPVTVLGLCGDSAHIQFGGMTGFVAADAVYLGEHPAGLEWAVLTLKGERIELRDPASLAALNAMLTEAQPRGYRMAGCPFEATLLLATGMNTIEVQLATDSCCIFRYNGYDYRYDAKDNSQLFCLFGVELGW